MASTAIAIVRKETITDAGPFSGNTFGIGHRSPSFGLGPASAGRELVTVPQCEQAGRLPARCRIERHEPEKDHPQRAFGENRRNWRFSPCRTPPSWCLGGQNQRNARSAKAEAAAKDERLKDLGRGDEEVCGSESVRCGGQGAVRPILCSPGVVSASRRR